MRCAVGAHARRVDFAADCGGIAAIRDRVARGAASVTPSPNTVRLLFYRGDTTDQADERNRKHPWGDVRMQHGLKIMRVMSFVSQTISVCAMPRPRALSGGSRCVPVAALCTTALVLRTVTPRNPDGNALGRSPREHAALVNDSSQCEHGRHEHVA
jgi:hypothetical protein